MNTKGTERVNEEGEIETKVETVDHRSSAGEGVAGREKVGVVHLRRDNKDSSSGGGVLAGAAAAVSNTFKSAKEAIMGKGTNNNSNNKPGTTDNPQ
ncbi:hypothetical protein LINPERHAP2_LOCUS41282 [Linum perenne]